MPPDFVSFFSRIKHNWFLFVLFAIALTLSVCLAVAVVSDDTGRVPDYPLPAGDEIDEYYRETGAVRERLTLDDIRVRALENGGFTYNPLYGATPQRGYAVSLCGYGKVFDGGVISNDELREYLHENVAQMRDPGRYVGGWVDDGRFYLDVSVILQDEKEARKLGRINDQTGIFDLCTGETIYLKDPDGQWLIDVGGNWLPGTTNVYNRSVTEASVAYG